MEHQQFLMGKLTTAMAICTLVYQKVTMMFAFLCPTSTFSPWSGSQQIYMMDLWVLIIPLKLGIQKRREWIDDHPRKL